MPIRKDSKHRITKNIRKLKNINSLRLSYQKLINSNIFSQGRKKRREIIR
jgi:hypothetical protein